MTQDINWLKNWSVDYKVCWKMELCHRLMNAVPCRGHLVSQWKSAHWDHFNTSFLHFSRVHWLLGKCSFFSHIGILFNGTSCHDKIRLSWAALCGSWGNYSAAAAAYDQPQKVPLRRCWDTFGYQNRRKSAARFEWVTAGGDRIRAFHYAPRNTNWTEHISCIDVNRTWREISKLVQRV